MRSRRAVSGLLAVGVLAFCIAPVLCQTVSQVHLGWLQNDVQHTMTVKWYAPSDWDQSVYYGSTSASSIAGYTNHVDGVSVTIAPSEDTTGTTLSPLPVPFVGRYYTAHLTGLLPGETYYFRVHDADNDTLTQEWSFRTIADDEAVEFAFAGDSQRPFELGGVDCAELRNRPTAPANWPYMRDFITQKAAGLDPDFFLGLGDFVARGNNQEQWHNWFDAWQENAVTSSGRMIPIVPVIGNHEMGGYPSMDSSYEWFLGMFAIPQDVPGIPWYSIDFPNLHLTVLAASSGQVKENMELAVYEAARQISWLVADLESSKAQAAAWRLVAFHYNVLGCFAACTDYPSDAYMCEWNQFLQGKGVDAIFMGHTHNYTRSWPVWLGMPNPCYGGTLSYELASHSDFGITYITHGGWGAVNTSITSDSQSGCRLQSWIAAAASHPSLGYVELGSQTCSFRVEDTAGILIDEFSLPYAPDYDDKPEYTEVVP